MPTSPQGSESTGSGAVLYVALELSARTWLLASGVGMGQALRRKTIPAGDREALRREQAAARARCDLAATAPVRSCYEAGRDGFREIPLRARRPRLRDGADQPRQRAPPWPRASRLRRFLRTDLPARCARVSGLAPTGLWRR